MKRKLVCLFLGILMLMTALLTGCSQVEDEETGEEVDNSAKTIVMWVMTPDYETKEDEAAAKKAQAEVQAAFTNITKSKFKTNVELKFVSADEYYKALEKTIKAEREHALLLEEAQDKLTDFLRGKDTKNMDELLKEFYEQYPQYKDLGLRGDVEGDEEEKETEEETTRNEFGVSEIKYPSAKENQVDIFYLSGYEKYIEYKNNEWLASLDDELALSSKKLTDYITASLLDGVQLNGSVYAIPNNVPIGEYTYALIDKEYFDKYYNKIDSVENVLDLNRFLNDMKNMNEANGKTPEDEGYVVPLASTFEECMEMLVWYWELSYTDRTVYETYYDEETDRYYALGTYYTVKVEKTNEDSGEIEEVDEVRVVPYAKRDQLFKVNAQGQYVNAKGEVLNYHYETVDDFRLQINGEQAKLNGIKANYVKKVMIEGTDEEKAELTAQAGGMYLVDENGIHITPENDERVILVTGETDLNDQLILEDDGTPMLPEIYDNDGNIVLIDNVNYDVEVVLDFIETPTNPDGWPRQSFYYDHNDDADFSVLGTIFKDAAKRSRGDIELSFVNLLADKEYRDLYTTLKNYEYEEYFGTPADGQLAAVSFMTGDARIKHEYDQKGVYVKDGREYYMFVAEYPEATEKELYGNMFAVYGYSNNLARSMEVITCLNTNAELRNLLQYGVEGWHYERDEDTGLVKLLNSGVCDKSCKEKCDLHHGTYRMDVEKTGNCFIVYPTVEQGADAWTYAKIQNNDSLINPLLGFDFNAAAENDEYNMDVSLIDYVNEASVIAYEQMMECSDKASLVATLDDLMAQYRDDAVIKKATNGAYDPAEGKDDYNVNGSSSPFVVYRSWLAAYGYNVAAPGAKN